MHASAPVNETVKWIAIGIQVVGVSLTLLGIAVVRSWLESAKGAAVEGSKGLRRWWTLRRERLTTWWARRRGRSVSAQISMSATARASASATVTVGHHRVDRATVSDRDWLAHLDDLVESLRVLVDEGAAARSADRINFGRQLDSHRQELREEILRSTRDGWQLIAAGLVFSALGIIVGGLN